MVAPNRVICNTFRITIMAIMGRALDEVDKEALGGPLASLGSRSTAPGGAGAPEPLTRLGLR
ncbi:MAG: hypothetical protein HC869_09525 [Rhodospirillales bacterium]|nr:hypothetical protein [Rhodospirillales bacterium]